MLVPFLDSVLLVGLLEFLGSPQEGLDPEWTVGYSPLQKS